MRFVSYNVHRCVGTDDRRSVERVARLLEGLRPDVVGLNEVVRARVGVDQPARLADALGMRRAFQANVTGRSTSYGNAVLSRGEIVSRRSVVLPGGREPRGLLVTEVVLGGLEVVFAVTHLSADRAARPGQVAAIAAALPRERPLVLAGDFNALPDELEALAGEHVPWLALADALPTFPATAPTAAIDRVLFSGHWRLIAAAAAAEPAAAASDHVPLVVDLASVY